MQEIIEFLEQYWGVTIVGGLTVGTLITFVLVQVKTLLSGRNVKNGLTQALDVVGELVTRLNTIEAEKKLIEDARLEEEQKYRTRELALQTDTVIKEEQFRAELKAKEEYYAKVQATTFQAISYLVLASKLPTEDKLALQQDFVKLGEEKIAEVKTVVSTYATDLIGALKKQEVPLNGIIENVITDTETVVEETKPVAKAIVDGAITKAQTLLDKYTTKGE